MGGPNEVSVNVSNGAEYQCRNCSNMPRMNVKKKKHLWDLWGKTRAETRVSDSLNPQDVLPTFLYPVVIFFNQPFSPRSLKSKKTAVPLKTGGNFQCMSAIYLIPSNTLACQSWGALMQRLQLPPGTLLDSPPSFRICPSPHPQLPGYYHNCGL